MKVHPDELQLIPQKCRLNGVGSTGKIKEHDPQSASSLFQVAQCSIQEENDGIIHYDAKFVGKLEWFQRAEMDKDQLFQGLHQVRSESNWSVTVEVRWIRGLVETIEEKVQAVHPHLIPAP